MSHCVYISSRLPYPWRGKKEVVKAAETCPHPCASLRYRRNENNAYIIWCKACNADVRTLKEYELILKEEAKPS